MNRILLILTFTLLADAVLSEIPCLTWEMSPDKLDVICRLNNVVLPVSIYDTFGEEQGKCVFKNFNALCSSVNKLANITANISKEEIKLSITNATRSLVKGEWSCIQGMQTFKTVISPSAGIIWSTEVFLTGNISQQSSLKTVDLSCFSCREPHGNTVEFLLNHHSVDNVRYDHVTKKCLHKDGECKPGRCACSNSGNWFTYTVDITNITKEISLSCDMRFVDKLISTRFSKLASVIYDGKEFISNGSETEITKAPGEDNHHKSDNETDSRPISPVKEDANFARLKWITIGIAVILLIVAIFYCRLRIIRKRKELLLQRANGELEELDSIDQPLMPDNTETVRAFTKEYEQRVGRLLLLYVNIAEKVIKKVISCKLLTNNQTFTSFLKNENNKHALFHAWHYRKRCCQCKTDDNVQKESLLTKQQFQFMFNNSGSVPQNHEHIADSKMYCLYNIAVNDNVSLDKIDVSLVYCLLVCCCTPEVVQELNDRQSIIYWMKKIKDMRNEIFHMTASEHLSEDEFTDKSQTTQQALIILAELVNPSFYNEIKEDIEVLKNENLEDRKVYLETLTEVLVQCKQDLNLKIHQLCDERFMATLQEANKVTDTSILYRERNTIIKIGEISMNIVEHPDVKVEDYPDVNTLDVLLRVQAPNDWNEDEIMEMIRLMVDQINSRGNIKVKETTLESFMLIVEIEIRTLSNEEILKTEVEHFFRNLCEQCKIDISQPNSVEVSIENLSYTNGQSIEENPFDVDLVYKKSFCLRKGKDAFFTNCAAWSDDHCLLVDRNNRLLLMYNHKTGDIQSEDLNNEPFSMAIIDNNTVAISFPDIKEIGIYNLSTRNKFTSREVKKVEGKCYTLTSKDDDETVLVYIEGKGIYAMNMSQKELTPLDIQFSSFEPKYDDICARNNRLYHTNRCSGSVFCYAMDGSMLWNFKTDLKRITSLTCDKYGNVYATVFRSHQLLFISADGQSNKVLGIKKNDMLLPTFVYYSMKKHCLLIVNRENGQAESYSIMYRQTVEDK